MLISMTHLIKHYFLHELVPCASALIFNTLPPKRDIWQLPALLNDVENITPEYVLVSSINPCVSYSQNVSLLFVQSPPTT